MKRSYTGEFLKPVLAAAGGEGGKKRIRGGGVRHGRVGIRAMSEKLRRKLTEFVHDGGYAAEVDS